MELQLGVTFERVLAAVQAQLDLETAQVSPGIDARLVSLKHTYSEMVGQSVHTKTPQCIPHNLVPPVTTNNGKYR